MQTWSQWPEVFRPKQLLFIGADIVGSTSLKQTMIQTTEGTALDANTKWFDLIQEFYIRLSELFLHEADPLDAEAPHLRSLKLPKVWKTVGDEVLFWTEVTDSRQLPHIVNAWRRAICRLREELRERYALPALDFKCTAWMAHFPWRNKMIFSSPTGMFAQREDYVERTNLHIMYRYFSPRGLPADVVLDFVGPGIDLGFRLATTATLRRFTISNDVAYMLARAAVDGGVEHGLRIHYEGLRTFKGVHGGSEYPLFWIDMSDGGSIEDYDSELRAKQPCRDEDIVTFIDTFYGERRNYVYAPFIVSETEEILRDRPSWYDAAHEKMLRDDGFRKLI